MRFSFIEAHLAVHGHIARRNFVDCSPVNATKVLAKYKAAHSGVLIYSEVTKRYTCTKVPTFHLQVDAARFLDAYNVLYGGTCSLAVPLREKHKITAVGGCSLQVEGA